MQTLHVGMELATEAKYCHAGQQLTVLGENLLGGGGGSQEHHQYPLRATA